MSKDSEKGSSNNIEITDEIIDQLMEKPITKFNPDCVRKKSNWSTMRNEFKLDHPSFHPDFFLKDMPAFSPKLVALLEKINELDNRDQKKYGKKFKHFVFSDIKTGGQGAKMLASAFLSSGWNLGYKSELKNRAQIDENNQKPVQQQKKIDGHWGPLELLSQRELLETHGSNFYLLSSIAVFDKPISVRMKKELLATFNSRPENIYGDLARIIIMDSGFKEGIDLFDIKYIHIFEPSMNMADQKQVIGRGTRTCGQKGLEFHPTRGWPLEVFIYDLDIPEKLRFSLLGATSTQDLLMRAMNADIRLANFGADIERLVVFGSVDYELNTNVHNFGIDLSTDDEDVDIVLGGGSLSDESLTTLIEDDNLGNGTFGYKQMVQYIRNNFDKYRWENVKMENMCGDIPEEWKEYEKKMRTQFEKEGKAEKEEKREGSQRGLGESSAKDSLTKSSLLSSLGESSAKGSMLSSLSESSEKGSLNSSLGESPILSSLNSRKSSQKSSQNSEEDLPTIRESINETINESLKKSPRKSVGGASSILSFSPTQEFIRNYFTPFAPVKGMLLYHSVGTGKTCSAIAAATSNFEPFDYTILWVTRTTLKNDIWKNMFDQVCHKSIQMRIANGEIIPNEQSERMKLLSKAWRIRPLSYKQFSNLVSKRNQYYEQLVKENGEIDPLQKTLLIIDEAHKLYGGDDLSSVERPDMTAFHRALMNSYAVSGVNSVRLLLMTATPITKSPLELVKLINLCKPVQQQMPENFQQFASKYLNDDGTFTRQGQTVFLDDIAGHISYLNREKDARQFSQPRIHRVMVPIVSETQMKYVEDFDAFVTRSESEDVLLKLQEELEERAKRMDDELMSISKLHFDYMYNKCDDIPESKCKAVIKKNIQGLMMEIRGYVKHIRDQTKSVRDEIVKIKRGRQAKLFLVKKKIRENPTLYSQYKSSAYAVMRDSCSSKSLSGAKLFDVVKNLPEMVEYDNVIQSSKENIVMLENRLKIGLQAYTLKIKELKDLLKKPEIAPVEKTAIEYSIREKETEFKETRKIQLKDTKDEIGREEETIKSAEKSKKKLFERVRKTLKKSRMDKKRLEQQAKKQTRSLRKIDANKLEINNDEVKDMVSRRMGLIEHDLSKLRKELETKEREKKEKLRKQEEKRVAKTLKEREKKEEKERRQLEKEHKRQTTRKNRK